MNRDLLATVGALVAIGTSVAVWGAVVVVTVVRGEPIPAELWAVPGVLIGSILAAFRTTEYVGRRRRPNGPDPVEDSQP